MDHPVISPKKLIEVALPLDAINTASVRESYIYRGNPSALHKWWAQRPLAAARAVLFAQLVNDPSWRWELERRNEMPPSHIKASWASRRKQLFRIIEDLVIWENLNNHDVLERARKELKKSWIETCEINKDHPAAAELFNPNKLPPLHDPFAGGGTIPLEARRLGLDTIASDLNPVAVLINKSMAEIPSRFFDRPAVNPISRTEPSLLAKEWQSFDGLADDIRYYSQWMRDEAIRRIGHLYPRIRITNDIVQQRPDLKPILGEELTVIAWLWARTVKSPSPAFSHLEVPLANTFVVSSRPGREVYVLPVIEGDRFHFSVMHGKPTQDVKSGTKMGRASFRCLYSSAPISRDYIMNEASAGRVGTRLMAAVAESSIGRVFLSPTKSIEDVATGAEPAWRPDVEFFQQALGFRVGNYAMTRWSDLFTRRQLVALTTLCDILDEVKERILTDATHVDVSPGDERSLEAGGYGPRAYAEALTVYLAFAISKHAMYGNALVPWYAKEDRPSMLFTQQVISMTWDFTEVNPFSDVGGSFAKSATIVSQSLAGLPKSSGNAIAMQMSATAATGVAGALVSTDPPYYDNIGYADLSDFFYVWLRRGLKSVLPSLFATISVPKDEELVATPGRHGNKKEAEAFFLKGMTDAMQRICDEAHPAFPVTIYYAFKQAETNIDNGTSSTGWETFLEAVQRAGLSLTGTWPMRTERSGRQRDTASNALASSVVLVCRQRELNAPTTSRRAFLRELNQVLPEAMDEMTRGSGGENSPVAPVDLSQAIIGPGMAVFSKYSAVLEADGTPMTVRTALQLINRFLAEDDFDADTQFCLHWFEQYGWETGKFGEADTLARAKGTSVDGVKQAGVLHATGGNVRLLKWAEYPSDWEPQTDQRLPIWEVLHQLIRVFNTDGETGAAAVFAAVQSKAEAARQLAYRLYTLCERKNWAEDARAYNEVVTSWSGIESAAAKEPAATQRTLFDN